MLDMNMVRMIEQRGCICNGKRIYGTAAVLHFLHMPVKDLDSHYTEVGRAYVQNYLHS